MGLIAPACTRIFGEALARPEHRAKALPLGRHIESRYPTQAKVRLEWGTQQLLPMWQRLEPAYPDPRSCYTGNNCWVPHSSRTLG